MLMGEHAVLFGHSALVCALTQRIYVRANKRNDGQLVIVSALGHFQCALIDLPSQLRLESPFSFVLQALALCELTEGVQLMIESEFEHTLGLGSSAAVTVASLGAMALLNQGRFDAQTVMQLGIESIRKVQGRGSGADVAASALGGMVKFKAEPVTAQKVQLSEHAWHSAPNLQLVYCGYKTPTPMVIEQVAQAALHEPQRFAQLYEQMGACIETAVKALNSQEWRTFSQSMNQYQSFMRALGVSDATIESIIQLAQEKAPLGALFGAKIAGSGLGDCVLLLGSERLDWPHPQISVQIDPQGLRQETSLPSQILFEKLL
jgi:mevalonate kinase